MRYSFFTFVFVLALGCFASLQILCGPVAAANRLSSPRVGAVRYGDGGVYLLYGLPGNYVLGPRVLDGADGVSFSERGGLAVRQGVLMLLDGQFAVVGTFSVGEEKPVLGIGDNPATALAWLPAARKLVYWNGQAFASVSVPDLTGQGEVSFVSERDGKTASLLLHTPDGSVSEASVSLGTGQVSSMANVAGARGASVRHGSFVLFSDRRDLAIVTPSNGDTKRFPLNADDVKVERVSSDCFHLSSAAGRRDWLLHFRNGNFELAELPPPSTEAAQ